MYTQIYMRNSRMSQHHGQGVLLDSGRPVETHVVDALEKFRVAVDPTRERIKVSGWTV